MRHRLLIFGLLLLILLSTVTGTSEAEHEEWHLEMTLEEGYYQPVLIDNIGDYPVEIITVSSHKIDIIVLTDAEFERCCDDEGSDLITFTDSRSSVSTKESSFVAAANEDGYILIIDNSEVVEGGELPSTTVFVEISFLEFDDDEYSFQFLGFLAGIIFVPLVIIMGMDSVFYWGWIDRAIVSNTRVKTLHEKALEYLSKNDELFYSKYPALTVIIGANIMLYLFGLIFGVSPSGATIQQGLNMGASSIWEVIQGDFFSLIASNFMHWDWQHLLFNMMGLYFLGPYLEKELGSLRFFSIAMLTGLLSSILSLAGLSISGGASGIVFAFIGLIFSQIVLGKIKRAENYCRYPDMTYFWSLFIVNIALMPFMGSDGIDLLGHIGGFGSGFAIGYYLFKGGIPGTEALQMDSNRMSRLVHVGEEHMQVIPNYSQLPPNGEYVYINNQRAYITESNHVWHNVTGDEFHLLSWLAPDEEE